MSVPALRVVTADGELLDRCPGCDERDDMIVGQEATIKSQAAQIGRLKRQLEEADVADHPQRTEVPALIDRWRKATGHPKAKQSKDRVELVKARLKDGYTFAQLELAIDGIAAFPFVVNGQRVREGKASQRHDSLSIALKGGENTERFAVLGYQARKFAA